MVNANIYTVNDAAPRAQAVLVEDGVITRVGSDEEILAGLDSQTVVHDLDGRFLMPGFQDTHLHVAEAGLFEMMCLFDETAPSISAYKRQFIDCAELTEQEDGPWILGVGIAVYDMLKDTSQTPRAFLDELFPETPVLILDNLGHAAWANSLAMVRAGYALENPRQPAGGIILTDDQGQATGELFENAQQRLRDLAFMESDPDQAIAYQGLLQGLQTMAENGVTTVSDAGGYWTRNDQDLWFRAEQAGRMTVRAFNALYLFPDRAHEKQIQQINALFRNDPNSRVHFNTVKIYVDGILSLGTSALRQSYRRIVVPELNFARGFEYFDPHLLQLYSREFVKSGFQLHFHSTGDRAASIALDAIAGAQDPAQSSRSRHRITHNFLVDEADFQRFREFGVTADIQLNPGALDRTYYRPFLREIIGSKREASLLPVRPLLDADVKVVLSSDYDAGPLSPLGTIERALTRRDNKKMAVPTLKKAIEMTTIDVAFALKQEDRTGSIEVGKWADMIVLDQDITQIPTKKIGSTKVLATLLGGEVVFDRQQIFEQ